jgi:signal transduction histidine kinase
VTVSSDLDGHRARISVQDNGCGIEPQNIPLLFESFAQVSHNGHGKTGGSGLGLAISKKIVKAHAAISGSNQPMAEGRRSLLPYR